MSSFTFPSTRVNLDFEWETDTPIEVNYKLAQLEAYLDHTIVLTEGAKEILQADMAEKFETETDPYGNRWEEIVKPEPEQIGILRRGSTDAQMYRDAISEDAWSASPVGVFFDSSALPPYWVHHEQPDSGEYRIPRREFIAASNQAQVEIEALGATWLEIGIAQAVRSTAVFNPKSGRFHDPATGRFTKGP